MWEQIRSNQARSVILVIGMGILLLFVGYMLGFAFLDDGIAGLVIAFLVWGIMNLVAYFQGDSILLSLAQAKKITRDDHPRLYNIVEEMKISSGLEKMPDIYITDDPALNAFATGRDPKNASLCVTSGLLQNLNRDELQGVVGHEISHIRNRDVLLMAMCSVLLGTIVILAWYGSRFMLFGGMGRSRRDSSSGGGGAQLIIIIIALVLMILAPIMAQLIYFAVSRKREYLADASSALYTRYPMGLASALEKISSSTVQLKSANQATAPMYILNPFRKKGRAASDLTSTHPPISERIRILRSMAGASYTEYNQAYQGARHSQSGVIPASALAAASIPLRQASAEPAGEELTETQKARETSGLLWRKSDYTTVDCQCGTRFRIPPGFDNAQFTCPHCGTVNTV
jgi:heat shock protein HtpX